MKCKCCGKELVVKDSDVFKKDTVKFIQKTFHCINPKCNEMQCVQKVSITGEQQVSF